MNDATDNKEQSRPFVVPCSELALNAPLSWLRAGWVDLRQTPKLSVIYGLVIFVISWALSALALKLGSFALLAALLSGFVFFAPLLAVGLYSISRDRELGRTPSVKSAWSLIKRVAGQAGVFALAQMVILMIWSRSGMMLNAFFPIQSGDTQSLLEFLAVGSAIGTVFASLTFATAAFSLPMIAERDVDMITACVSSINAVLRNKVVCFVWATLIALLTGLGIATLGLGLIIIMPWLAFAAWHSYRETLDASSWPRLP